MTAGAGWITVTLDRAPLNPILIPVAKILSVGRGAGPEGGSRVGMTNDRVFDVTENIDVIMARMTEAGR